MKKFLSVLLLIVLFPCLAGAETVVTSFYPIWIMTLNLTAGLEDRVTVRNLAPPSAGCLHDYQLQTADMKVLSEADVFLVNGAGMEAFLPEISRAFPDLPVIVASEGIDLLADGQALEILESEEEGVENAHIWLDPSRAVRMAENLARTLEIAPTAVSVKAKTTEGLPALGCDLFVQAQAIALIERIDSETKG